jgi:osmotically-inducible protein OsmY
MSSAPNQQELIMSAIAVDFPLVIAEGEAGPDPISERAHARLRQAPYLELRHVECIWEENILKLRGHVSSYYLRQIAQTLVQGLDGVEAIDNQLDVLPGRLPRNCRP